MGFHGERILIISPESWGKSMLSKHHYAVELAKMGNEVHFLLPPWADRELALKHAHQDVHLLFDNFSIKGARFLPSLFRKWIYRRIVQDMERAVGGAFTLVWSFDNSRFFDLDCFSQAWRIHHMMDYHTDYQTAIASRSAHLNLGVTDGIVDKLRTYNRKAHFVQHGYATVPAIPCQLPTVQTTKKALYTGNLLMPFVHWPWLHALVASRTDVHFFLAGSYGLSNLNEQVNDDQLREIQTIARQSNVTLLGECSPGQMQDLFTQVDVLFFAYRSNEFPEILANSHKIMAYLASGKPIVCHQILQYLNQPDLLYMCDTLDKYVATFKDVIDHPERYATSNLVEKRRDWALQNTYVHQIERVFQLTKSLQKVG
jgi:glycosyltransferase involved in cell wall biosynthesis